MQRPFTTDTVCPIRFWRTIGRGQEGGMPRGAATPSPAKTTGRLPVPQSCIRVHRRFRRLPPRPPGTSCEADAGVLDGIYHAKLVPVKYPDDLPDRCIDRGPWRRGPCWRGDSPPDRRTGQDRGGNSHLSGVLPIPRPGGRRSSGLPGSCWPTRSLRRRRSSKRPRPSPARAGSKCTSSPASWTRSPGSTEMAIRDMGLPIRRCAPAGRT